MSAVLTAFAPIWVLTAIGYLAARSGVLGERADVTLGRFAFYVAMPAVLFTTLMGSPIGRLANRGMLVFATGTIVVGAIGFALSRWVFRRRLAEAAVGAMSASYVNSANLGIPVAVQVLGDSTFIAAVVLFQVLVLTPVVLTAVEADTNGSGGRRLRALLLLPVRNPIIAASIAGVLVSALGWHPPDVLTQPIRTLAGAGVPTALIVLGMSLHTKADPPAGGARAELGWTVALKLIAQPAVTYLAGRLLGVDGHLLFAAVVCAALPTAQNAFVFANQYRLDDRLPRNAVLTSTLLAMISLSLVAWFMA
ncbi:AEC family transporter [Solihabitans fulvus]|uniref:AEC family transporter n=1 Tax=Solihabitans fulvus TaxID=1892852 RepID=A0A5B2XUK5_9PSEU|nr:AEC family transporter [Solihabitans fulvus]KAA2266494.1 AEC family transporter [Solihabitans fulvus]